MDNRNIFLTILYNIVIQKAYQYGKIKLFQLHIQTKYYSVIDISCNIISDAKLQS